MKMIVAKIVILAIAGICIYYMGKSSNPRERVADLKQQIEDMEKRHKKDIADKDKVIERKNEDIKKWKIDAEALKGQVDKYEGLYRTRTVVCIALGAAVVGALFVGTLMGAKGRRDALRVCKDCDVPIEKAV